MISPLPHYQLTFTDRFEAHCLKPAELVANVSGVFFHTGRFRIIVGCCQIFVSITIIFLKTLKHLISTNPHPLFDRIIREISYLKNGIANTVRGCIEEIPFGALYLCLFYDLICQKRMRYLGEKLAHLIQTTQLFACDQKILNESPKFVLSQLYEYLKNTKISHLLIKFIDDGKIVPAVDDGGPIREFLTTLFEKIGNKNRDEPWLPELDPTESEANHQEQLKRCYVIGRLMGFCLINHKIYRIGNQHFNPGLYQALVHISKEEARMPESPHLIPLPEERQLEILQTLYSEDLQIKKMFRFSQVPFDLLIGQEFKESVSWAYPDSDDLPEDLIGNPSQQTIQNHWPTIQQRVRSHLLKKAIRIILPMLSIAHGMKDSCTAHQKDWDEIRRKTTNPKNVIEGELDKNKLKKSFQGEDLSILNYFTRWVDEASEKELEKFLFIATGTTTVPPNKFKIVVTKATEDHLLVFHTCHLQIDTPPYPNYSAFNKKMQKALEYATGYQFH